MRVCITGGAGFIGSHLTRAALDRGWHVRVLDNFLTGRREFLPAPWKIGDMAEQSRRLEVIEGSIHDHEDLIRAIDGCDWVIHMAANAEGRRGLTRPTWDIQQNILGTSAVLEAMRAVGVDKVFYASSGSVYGNYQPKMSYQEWSAAGEPLVGMIPEDAPFPTQTSLYGASKIAGEGLIGAYCEGWGTTGVIGRWMQAIGERYLHGHVIDFVRKLRRSPGAITILGDGTQAKSGLYAGDLAEGILTAVEWHNTTGGLGIYNYGTTEHFTIDESARLIANTMGLPDPHIAHHGDTWPGDSPVCFLDSTRARGLGWTPQLTIQEAIVRAVEYLIGPECKYL